MGGLSVMTEDTTDDPKTLRALVKEYRDKYGAELRRGAELERELASSKRYANGLEARLGARGLAEHGENAISGEELWGTPTGGRA